MRMIPTHFVLFAAFTGLSMASPSVANAACAISVGKGEGPSQSRAVRLARQDARQKAGNIRPDNASYSEPMCFVADDFKKGVATYGCEVEYSYCTTPKLPGAGSGKGKQKAGKVRDGSGGYSQLAKGRIALGHPHWGAHRKHHNRQSGKWHGSIQAGAWGRTRTEVSCLRFNASASGRTVEQATGLLSGALIKSMAANIGGGFQHGKVEMTGPSCSQTGSHKVTCDQTARYCF